MTFKEAVASCNGINEACERGLRALGKYSCKVSAQDTSQINGSVDLDKAMKSKYPSANRWDYIVGYNNTAYFVEVHPAFTKDIEVIEEKLRWLKNELSDDLKPLDEIKARKPYYWIYTNGVHLLKQSPQYKAMVSRGLAPVKELHLE